MSTTLAAFSLTAWITTVLFGVTVQATQVLTIQRALARMGFVCRPYDLVRATITLRIRQCLAVYASAFASLRTARHGPATELLACPLRRFSPTGHYSGVLATRKSLSDLHWTHNRAEIVVEMADKRSEQAIHTFT